MLPLGGSVRVFAAVSNPSAAVESLRVYTLCADTAPTIKPEVHYVSQRHQRRTEPQPYIGKMQKNVVKIGHVVLEICSQTDRHTDKQTCSSVISILRSIIGGGVISKSCSLTGSSVFMYATSVSNIRCKMLVYLEV